MPCPSLVINTAAVVLLQACWAVTASGQTPFVQVRYDGDAVVRAEITSQRDLMTMLALSDDPWSERVGIGPVDFRVSREALAAIGEAGIAYRVLIEDVQAGVDAERERLGRPPLRGPGWFEEFRDYAEIGAYVDELAALRPDLAQRFTVGQSLEGRDIFGLRITGPAQGEKPAVLLNALQHAREWITPPTAMFIADRLVREYDTDPAVRDLVDRTEFLIVPVANPDGYVYTWDVARYWRKNRRHNGGGVFGVDLNRNWSHQWGSNNGSSGNPNSETYRGPAAFSEPCSTHLGAFIASNPHIVLHFDIHSYGQLLLHPWGHTIDASPDATLFDELNSGLTQSIFAVHGRTYRAGPCYTTIYPVSGGMLDWAYGQRGILSYTPELRGNDFVIHPGQILPTARETFGSVAWITRWAHENTLRFEFPAGLPGVVRPDSPTALTVGISRGSHGAASGSERLLWRSGGGGAFVEAPLTPRGEGVFEATLPGAPCGATVEFYIEARAASGATVMHPPAGPDAPFEVLSLATTDVFTDDAETDRGWSLGAPDDDATAGLWTRADPNGSPAQPEDDHTPGDGALCVFTGQSLPGRPVGDNDVENGRTTLTSPAFDLSGFEDGVVGYWRWYSTVRGGVPSGETLAVEISADDGQTWAAAETVGPIGPDTIGGWRYHEFRVAEIVDPSPAVRVRFIASDLVHDTIVEAAVDDVRVRGVTGCSPPPCRTDWNTDGTVTSDDFFAFLDDYFAGDADFNGDSATTSDDFFAFLAAFFDGCP